jgi:diaminopimelate epimerase
MRFSKYHALGNDYVVMAPDAAGELTAEMIRRICHRNYGIGSDGILLGPLESRECDFGLRIFNPDGSEAEKSGNGLRIFARALWDSGQVADRPFSVDTAGGKVTCTVKPGGKDVTVEMGKVSFHSTDIPVAGAPREVLNEDITVSGRRLVFCAATVGNPHCVVLSPNPSPEEARQFGPLIEVEARFPNRTNVQFMQVIDPANIRIEIWERGAGYTLASGSSSTAAAAVAKRLGLCGDRIRVHMPGGTLDLEISDDYHTVMTGPVTQVCEGVLAGEMFDMFNQQI